MGMTAALIGGGALLGGLMGSKNKTTTSTSSSAPWEPQQQYLKYGFGEGQDAYNAAKALGTYQGDRVADMNPYQTAGYNLAGNTGLGMGYDFGSNQATTGNNMLGSAANYGNNAANLFSQYQNGDPTAYALNTANQFASSPYLNGQIDAASRDVARNLNEQQLPAALRSQVAGGNINSTRAGVQDAILQRGAQDRVADISAGLRGNAFNQGLTSGLNQYNTNLSNLLSTNNQLYNAGNLGSSLLNNGLSNIYTGANNATAAGAGFQNQNQNEINGQMSAFNDQRNNQLDLLKQYMGIVGGNYGGTSTGTQTTPGVGFLQGALGGAMGAAGLASGFGGAGSTGGASLGGSSLYSLGGSGGNLASMGGAQGLRF